MHDQRQLQHERLLYFSDAVFAIAITLLVIELRVPEGITTDTALRHALLDLIPGYISFLVSFFVIGRFWIGHHRLFGYLAHSDAGLVWRNLAFLAVIAFLPFPTAVLGSHASAPTAILLYAAWLLVAATANLAIIAHVRRHPALLAAPLTPAQRRELRSAWQPVVIGLAAGGAAFASPLVAVLVLSLLPFALMLLNRLLK